MVHLSVLTVGDNLFFPRHWLCVLISLFPLPVGKKVLDLPVQFHLLCHLWHLLEQVIGRWRDRWERRGHCLLAPLHTVAWTGRLQKLNLPVAGHPLWAGTKHKGEVISKVSLQCSQLHSANTIDFYSTKEERKELPVNAILKASGKETWEQMSQDPDGPACEVFCVYSSTQNSQSQTCLATMATVRSLEVSPLQQVVRTLDSTDQNQLVLFIHFVSIDLG